MPTIGVPTAAAMPVIIQRKKLFLSLFAGSVCLVSAARIVWRSRRGGNARGVVQCPGGLVCVLPDRVVVAPWDEVESIWDGGRRFRIRVHPHDGLALRAHRPAARAAEHCGCTMRAWIMT